MYRLKSAVSQPVAVSMPLLPSRCAELTAVVPAARLLLVSKPCFGIADVASVQPAPATGLWNDELRQSGTIDCSPSPAFEQSRPALSGTPHLTS